MSVHNPDKRPEQPEPDAPYWTEGVLVARCAWCRENPGAKYPDGSGVCPACEGSAYKVLAAKWKEELHG